MQKILGVLVISYIFLTISYGQEKTYLLQSKQEKSRISTTAIKKLATDQFRSFEVEDVFSKPKKGKFDVYFFIATYQGNSFDGTIKTFHDYLVLKVDPKTLIIVDGYQYTKEWTDSPQIDLYRIQSKNTLFTAGITIESLDFCCPYLTKENFRYHLGEKGVLQLY